jgi:hypothetical protein
MMTCKQVSTLLSTGALADAPLGRRLAVRMHLAMCRHCSAFKRWIHVLGEAARLASHADDAAAPAEFEARTLRRLEGR